MFAVRFQDVLVVDGSSQSVTFQVQLLAVGRVRIAHGEVPWQA